MFSLMFLFVLLCLTFYDRSLSLGQFNLEKDASYSAYFLFLTLVPCKIEHTMFYYSLVFKNTSHNY